ncbi:DpnD/PcfM family protein [Bacteroides fragilis]|nr:DpnD/PcfM family protein [Bacteroides fragilis]MCE8655321.1 DpnD/PcfM family protein [Bacteroides fragilis]
METYQIIVRETLEEKVEIEAETPSLAVCTAEDQYNAAEIVLSADNHVGTDISLSVEDKSFQRHLTNPSFQAFVDAKLLQQLPVFDVEDKIQLAFGSPDNAISEFERYGNQPIKTNIYLLYTCNSWHECNSQELIAPFSSKELVYAYVTKNRETYHLSNWDIDFFKDNNQTQGHNTNLIMECYEIDPK